MDYVQPSTPPLKEEPGARTRHGQIPARSPHWGAFTRTMPGSSGIFTRTGSTRCRSSPASPAAEGAGTVTHRHRTPLLPRSRRTTIRRILREVAAEGVRAIDWLGGDPLCRDDWYELAREARDLGLVNNIWTSGIPLADPAVARQVARVTSGGFVSVHLDSLDETIYQLLHTGEPGTKQEAILRGVENLLACGKPPGEIINCITFTRPLSGRDVERTIRHFAEKGIRTCLTQICAAGLGAEHPEWVPSGPQIEHAIGIRDRLNYPGSDISMSTMDTNKFYCGGTGLHHGRGGRHPVFRHPAGIREREPGAVRGDRRRHRRESALPAAPGARPFRQVQQL